MTDRALRWACWAAVTALLLASAAVESGERGDARIRRVGPVRVPEQALAVWGSREQASIPAAIPALARLWRASAYCACREVCCPPPRGGSGLTASGARPRQGWTLACPPEIPLGTLVRVTVADLGSRLFACQDRGAAIAGRRVDIYMNTHEAALDFGLRPAKVEVIGK